MSRVLDSIEVFFENLAAVDFRAIALAIGFHVVRGAAVSRAWRNVIADAYPEEKAPWRAIYGSYLAGVGVNALIPARAGDAVRLYLAKHRLKDATYTTLTTTLLVMSIFDFAAALGLFLFALSQGVLPSLDVLPSLPSFDFGWLFERPQLAAALALLLGIGLGVAIVWAARHVQAFRERVGQGFAVLRDKPRYLRRVVAWQVADWSCRLATTYWFLHAFHVEATVRNAFVAQVSQSLSTALPISPGGIGTEQALLVIVLSDQASRSDLISLSVGMKLTIMAVNLLLGFGALLLMAKTLSWREIARRRRAEESAEGAPPADEAAAERPAGSP
ncbi:MAG: lysylphosphatidylglycerol synthase transmembrane domain-containing protein [Gaiellaceae bacterium]